MSTTSTLERETNANTQIVSSSPSEERNNTIFVHAEPSTFRHLVQKLTGAPNKSPHNLPLSSLPSSKRPKLQERRRGMKQPARLEIRFTRRLKFVPQYYKPVQDPILSPVSTMDYAFFFSSSSPLSSSSSPPSNCFRMIDGPAVVLSKEEEEREEKAIQEKGFYLHNSPRSANDEKPKLLPLFPVVSINSFPSV